MTHPLNPFAGADAPLALDARALPAALAMEPPAAYAPAEAEDPMKRVEVRNGVALVTVRGCLSADDYWWGESYPDVVRRAEAALASPQVRAVALVVDSPGGTTSGLFDAMRKLRTAKAASGKRMVAWVSQQATSAAYALASTADEVVLDEVAGVGSIGTIAAMTSRAEQLSTEGIDVRVVASGEEKTDGHPAVPISEAAVGRLQARVAAVAERLFSEIAAARPALTVDAQRSLQAGVRYGRDAVAAGLADRVGTLDSVLAGLAPAAPANPYGPRAAAAPTAPAATKRTTMDEKIAALIAARTGETDPERQYGALQALLTKAERHDELAAKVSKIEEDAETAAFEGTLKAGLDAHKINAEEASWWREERTAGRATSKSLDANLARRAAPKLAADDLAHIEARQPGAGPTPATGSADPRLAGILAKPYAALTWDERNTLAALAPDTHERLYRSWVDAGRPAAA